jgi:hypothetical protein
MASMQICYKDRTTGQYVCNTKNVYSATTTQADADKKKPEKGDIERQVKEMIDKYLQESPDYFTIVYVAADD